MCGRIIACCCSTLGAVVGVFVAELGQLLNLGQDRAVFGVPVTVIARPRPISTKSNGFFVSAASAEAALSEMGCHRTRGSRRHSPDPCDRLLGGALALLATSAAIAFVALPS
jgi:hypothetical protein